MIARHIHSPCHQIWRLTINEFSWPECHNRRLSGNPRMIGPVLPIGPNGESYRIASTKEHIVRFLFSPHDGITTDIVRNATAGPKRRG